MFGAYLFPPSYLRTDARLRVDLKGPKGRFVRITDPKAVTWEFSRRGKILRPKSGTWRIELVAGAVAPRRGVKVRVRKNF